MGRIAQKRAVLLKCLKGGEYMLETIQEALHTFWIFHVNAFYAIGYFLKNNFFFIFVLIAIAYMVFEELKAENYNYVNDERRII